MHSNRSILPSLPPTANNSHRLPWGLAWRIALGQIVAWGILFFAFTVMMEPIQQSTDWSRTFLNGGLSLGLLVSGACTLPVGLWVQRRGGRELMATASALGGVALTFMGAWPHPIIYYVAWLALGLAMAGLLYDPAFAVITAAFGPEYRRGITFVTLFGGLAGTVFIPLAQFAIDHLGWRHALIVLGLAHIVIGVPLHAFGIPRHTRPATSRSSSSVPLGQRVLSWWREFRNDISDSRFIGLALWFTAYAAAFTGLTFQIVPSLQALGTDNGTIVTAIAVIGPVQVLGRLALMQAREFSTLRMGRWVMAGFITALLVLLFLPPRLIWLVVFAVLFGLSNGVITILRGTSVAELFGRERYAELNGALSAPAVLARAAAPLGMASLWSATGEPKAVFAGVFACLVAGTAGLMLATRAQKA